LLLFDGRKCLLLAHVATLFTVFEPMSAPPRFFPQAPSRLIRVAGAHPIR
jgi:hypothetical protein